MRLNLENLIDNNKDNHESGLEYVIFELYKHALMALVFPQMSITARRAWQIGWDMCALKTLDDIKKDLKARSEEEGSVYTQDLVKNLYDFKNLHEDDRSTYLGADLVFKKVAYGKYQEVDFGAIDFSKIESVDMEAYEKLYKNPRLILASFSEKISEYNRYKNQVAEILVAVYKYVIEELDNEHIINALEYGDDVALYPESDEFFRKVATALVDEKPMIVNLEPLQRRSFNFETVNLGFGEILCNLNLNNLDRIDTTAFNNIYKQVGNDKIGAAELILSKLGIHSLQAKEVLASVNIANGGEEKREASPSPLVKLFNSRPPMLNIFAKKSSGSPLPSPAPVSPVKRNSFSLPFASRKNSPDINGRGSAHSPVPSPGPSRVPSPLPLKRSSNKLG